MDDIENLWTDVMGNPAPSAPEAERLAPAPAPAPERLWYVAIDGVQVGPIDKKELESRWNAGEIDGRSLVWKAGMSDWAAISDVRELADLAAAPAEPAAASSTSSAHAPWAQPAAQVDWKPSAAQALASLVEWEIKAVVAEPEQNASTAPATSTELSFTLPGFAGVDLFPQQGREAPAAAPLTAAGAATWNLPASSWATPHPSFRSQNAVKILYAFLGLIGVSVVGLLGVIVYLMTRGSMLLASPALAPAAVASAAPAGASAPATASTLAAVAPAPSTASAPPAASAPATPSAAAPAPLAAVPSAAPRPSPPTSAAAPRSKARAAVEEDVDELVEADDAPAAKSRLTQADVHEGVRANASSLQPCIVRARREGEIDPGSYRFVLDWTVKPNGGVGSVQLKGPSSVLDTTLPGCFAAAMRKWKFAASEQTSPVRNYPLPVTVR